jgi:hypothetical protein
VGEHNIFETYHDVVFLDPPWSKPETTVVDSFAFEEVQKICARLADTATTKYVFAKLPLRLHHASSFKTLHKEMAGKWSDIKEEIIERRRPTYTIVCARLTAVAGRPVDSGGAKFTAPVNCYVGILTHEGRTQHEQMCVGSLSQFFPDNNNVATGVKTFVIDNAIGDRVVNLAKADNYSKTVCQVPYLINVGYDAHPVMFILCHGSERSAKYRTPYLNFSEDAARNILYPCSGFSKEICLHHVICNSKLVFLMCCNCDQIVPAYLAERRNDFPDIVYFNCGTVMQITHSIFMGWLIKMIDSNVYIGRNPIVEALYHGVKQSVVEIMSMVRQCKDKDEFFGNVIEWGCIAKYTTEKEKEDQALPKWRFHKPERMQDFYRVYGNTNNEWITDHEKELLFKEFQSLTLLERGDTDTAPVYKTVKRVDTTPVYKQDTVLQITDSTRHVSSLLCRLRNLR